MNLSITPEFMPRVRWHESMSAHTSWRAGGPADMLFLPRDIEDLAAFLRALPATVPVYWVGLGSNLLVREGGIRGVVVATAGAFTRIERRSQSRIHCQASVPCARIARACVNWGLAQAEFFGGIPGTFGGALAMNAGAFGDETWRHVLSVETIDRHGQRRTRTAQDFHVGYRQVEPVDSAARAGAEEWFLSAELQFEPRTGEPSSSVRSLTERRRQTQPTGQWSCGVRANAGEREGLLARPHSCHGGRRLWRRNRHICEKYRYGDYPHSAHPHSAHTPSGVNCVNSMRRPAVGSKFRKYKFRRRHYSKRRCRFNPQIAEAHFAGAFDLNPNQPVLAELSGVVVNHHRHHVPVEDVNHLVAVRDDVVLVPVVDLDVAAEFVLVDRKSTRLNSSHLGISYAVFCLKK